VTANVGLLPRFYGATLCWRGLGSHNSVCPPVRLSVTRVLCN